MASERQQAKNLIRDRDRDEPDLNDALALGRKKQLEIAQEANRHKEELQRRELGSLGRLLGGPSQASINSAFLVAVVCILAAIGCVIASAVLPASNASIDRAMTGFFTLGSSAIGYLVGARKNR